MRQNLAIAICLLGSLVPVTKAEPLTESVFTEIVKEANVVTETDKTGKPAKPNDVFRIPDLVRTGDQSRVELTAKDKTITRVGANTTFTFAKGGRDVILQKGGVLFHAPAGAGGGAVRYRGSSAAVLGTTFVAQVMPDRSYKVMDLEGHVKVTLPDGSRVVLKPGEMVIVPADQSKFGDVSTFSISDVSAHMVLLTGFSHPVSSQSLIGAAASAQNQQIASGKVVVNTPWGSALQGMGSSKGGSNGPAAVAGSSNPLDFPGHGIGPAPGMSPAGAFFPQFSPALGPPSLVRGGGKGGGSSGGNGTPGDPTNPPNGP